MKQIVFATNNFYRCAQVNLKTLWFNLFEVRKTEKLKKKYNDSFFSVRIFKILYCIYQQDTKAVNRPVKKYFNRMSIYIELHYSFHHSLFNTPIIIFFNKKEPPISGDILEFFAFRRENRKSESKKHF